MKFSVVISVIFSELVFFRDASLSTVYFIKLGSFFFLSLAQELNMDYLSQQVTYLTVNTQKYFEVLNYSLKVIIPLAEKYAFNSTNFLANSNEPVKQCIKIFGFLSLKEFKIS